MESKRVFFVAHLNSKYSDWWKYDNSHGWTHGDGDEREMTIHPSLKLCLLPLKIGRAPKGKQKIGHTPKGKQSLPSTIFSEAFAVSFREGTPPSQLTAGSKKRWFVDVSVSPFPSLLGTFRVNQLLVFGGSIRSIHNL